MHYFDIQHLQYSSFYFVIAYWFCKSNKHKHRNILLYYIIIKSYINIQNEFYIWFWIFIICLITIRRQVCLPIYMYSPYFVCYICSFQHAVKWDVWFTCTRHILYVIYVHSNTPSSGTSDLHVLAIFCMLYMFIPTRRQVGRPIYMYSPYFVLCVFVNYMYIINWVIRMRDQTTSTAGKTG